MDLSKIMVFFLTYLISLDFNSAESGDSDAGLQDIELSDETTTPYVSPRFTLAFSKGSPRATSVFERRSQALVEKDVDDVDDPQARAVYWIPTNCDSLSERGYTCIGCGESLHCMGGNFALKAICLGRRPYCHNGVCSSIPGEKCKNEGHIANPAVQPGHETHIADQTIQPTGQETHIADQAIQPSLADQAMQPSIVDPAMQSAILPANATL
ncbi:hypothetical protein ABMA27_004937 [Loxostege sticticalis]|uniref:Uncharacterized protein n=1 Tax=Loxostege sticticalis TaxID=481309 RepID=A0ABR3HL69_LOXSC